MKRFNLLSLLLVAFTALTVNAQTADNKWAISVGGHATTFNVNDIMDGFGETDDWNFSFGKVSLVRYLNDYLEADLTLSAGEVDQTEVGLNDKFLFNGGLGLRLMLATLLADKVQTVFDPYVRVGANYHNFDYSSVASTLGTATSETRWEDDFFTPSVGVGANFWVAENIAINLATDYNINMGPQTFKEFSSTGDFMQHSASLVFKLGAKEEAPAAPVDVDTDGDGVVDRLDACPTVYGTGADGCPLKADAVAKNVSFQNVEFDTNKATIRASSDAILSTAASIIKQADSAAQFYIDGHTDSDGSAAYNKALSEKRATAVVESLESKGVTAGVLTPRGFGEEQPIADNTTAEGKQRNRRVEITVK